MVGEYEGESGFPPPTIHDNIRRFLMKRWTGGGKEEGHKPLIPLIGIETIGTVTLAVSISSNPLDFIIVTVSWSSNCCVEELKVAI